MEISTKFIFQKNYQSVSLKRTDSIMKTGGPLAALHTKLPISNSRHV